jgi:DNA-binding transcriptional LysR family regulator
LIALQCGRATREPQPFVSFSTASETFPGYYLYYAQRRHASRALRALIEHLKKWRKATRIQR